MADGTGQVQACKTIYSAAELPKGLTRVLVKRVIDGDTFTIPADGKICRPVAHGKDKKAPDECSLRLGHNSTEKIKKEDGSFEARDHLREQVEGKEVLVKFEGGQDHYGRMLARRVYLPFQVNGVPFYHDVYAEIIQAGLAHVYSVNPAEESDRREELLVCQREAKHNKKGLWEPSPDSRFSGDIHITSFHANGMQYPGLDCKGDNEPPNCEYFRIAIISEKPIDLGNYQVEICGAKNNKPIELPHAMIPPGVTVKIHSGEGANQLDPAKGELVVYLKKEKQIWDDNGSTVVIRHKSGVVQDFAHSKSKVTCRP